MLELAQPRIWTPGARRRGRSRAAPPLGLGVLQRPQSSGTSSWTPPAATSATLVLWLRADLGVTQSSGKVSAWADQSGNGYNFSEPSSTHYPPFVSSAIGGEPGVGSMTNGSAAALGLTCSATLATILASATGADRFMVLQAASSQSTGTGLFSGNFGSSTQDTYLPYTDGNTYDEFFSTSRREIASTAFTSASLYETISTASEWTALVNGTQVFTTSSNTVGAPSSDLTLLYQFQSGTSGFGWAGYLCELAVYNGKLSGTDRTAFQNYSLARYGVG